MMRVLGCATLFSVATLSGGCAVTEPDDRDTARVRAAVEHDDQVSISDLASDLGISEVAVITALPAPMRRAVPTDDPEISLPMVCEVGPVDFQFFGIGEASAVTRERRIEVRLLTDDRVELQGDDGYPKVGLRTADLVYIYLIRMEGVGPADCAIYFFDSAGDRLMVWHVIDSDASIASFDRAWAQYND